MTKPYRDKNGKFAKKPVKAKKSKKVKKVVKKVLRHNVPEGFLIGYKKAEYKGKRGNTRKAIVTLLIPDTSHAIMANSNNYDLIRSDAQKCRTDYAEVLKIETAGGCSLPEGTVVTSQWDSSVKYEVGKVVVPNSPFDRNTEQACRSGIHFFLKRKYAVGYP